MRAIDADELVKELTKPTGLYADCERCSWSISNECMDCIVEDVINRMPTIDPVKHGKWLYKGIDGDWQWHTDGKGQYWHNFECSICHKKQTNENYTYCPYCGAKMGGAE